MWIEVGGLLRQKGYSLNIQHRSRISEWVTSLISIWEPPICVSKSPKGLSEVRIHLWEVLSYGTYKGTTTHERELYRPIRKIKLKSSPIGLYWYPIRL